MDNNLELLKGIVGNCGKILHRDIMETGSHDFADMTDKMVKPLIAGAMRVLREKYPSDYNNLVDEVNYILGKDLKTPYKKI